MNNGTHDGGAARQDRATRLTFVMPSLDDLDSGIAALHRAKSAVKAGRIIVNVDDAPWLVTSRNSSTTVRAVRS